MTSIHRKLLTRATWIQMYGPPNILIDADLMHEAADTIRMSVTLNMILFGIIAILGGVLCFLPCT